MAAITVNGVATSFTLPQYIGELFQKRERPNAVLRLIGGLTGALRVVTSLQFSLGVDYELPLGSQPAILEGAQPTSSEISTSQNTNLVQIFHEAVEITYSREGASGTIDGLAAIPGSQNGELNRPGTLEWQIERKMEKIARDINFSLVNGVYQLPADNTTARKTRGLLSAIATNVFANGGTPRAITKAIFETALQNMVANGSIAQGSEVYVVCEAQQFANLTSLYEGDTRLPESREVVGVSVRTIATKWAVCHMVWEPDMPTGQILILRPELCRVAALLIPQRGLLFAEPLAKVGSSEKHQIYGELGLDYRHEIFHAVIKDLS